MKHTSPIPEVQAAARTICDLQLAPLAAYQYNRIAAVMDALELPGSLGDTDLDLYARVRDAVEAAYHAGFVDSRLTLGEL